MVDEQSPREYWEKMQADARNDLWKGLGGVALGLVGGIALAIWTYYDLRDFEINGGVRFLNRPTKMLYEMFGLYGAAFVPFISGLVLAGASGYFAYTCYSIINEPFAELTPKEEEKYRLRAERKERRARERGEEAGGDQDS